MKYLKGSCTQEEIAERQFPKPIAFLAFPSFSSKLTSDSCHCNKYNNKIQPKERSNCLYLMICVSEQPLIWQLEGCSKGLYTHTSITGTTECQGSCSIFPEVESMAKSRIQTQDGLHALDHCTRQPPGELLPNHTRWELP